MAKPHSDDNNNDTGGKSEDPGRQSPAPTWLSWSVRGFSLAVILGLIAYFVWATVRPVVEPVINFTTQTDKIEQRGGGWALPVKVVNDGTLSVHALKVNAVLTEARGEPESSITIALLGPDEEVTTTFWFLEDPRDKGPRFTVESYLRP